jgi:uncharacterized membrane protein
VQVIQNKKPSNTSDSMVTTITTIVSPLPPPSILESYEKITPGFAERIIKMTEKQSEHRQKMEVLALKANISQDRKPHFEAILGQIFAFLITIFTVFMGVFAAIKGAQISGTILGGIGLVSIIYVFIKGRDNKKTKD